MRNWEHLGMYFLHGHAEWVRIRNLMAGNLIHTLELKLQPFEVSPCVCIGSHAFAMFSARAHSNMTTFTHFG